VSGDDLTEGLRLYAIGDVHGRLDLLSALLERIRADLSTRPHPRPRLVFLGDYIDRGPECRGVLETLIGVKTSGDPPADFLLGNHDSYVSTYLRDPDWYDQTRHWLQENMGGNATLASYGVPGAGVRDPAATREAFAAAFPAEHLEFLDTCVLILRIGGYLFVHAGIRPGVPLDRQDPDDLLWIRRGFLDSTTDFGFKVVHGHTVVPAVEHHRNRIAVDTGAVRTGVLSCVCLEGADVALLEPSGPRPWPLGSGLPSWRNLWLRR
jgi:serine/threonine protein phosphatase 1